MIESARQLKPLVPVSVLPVRPEPLARREPVPVVLRATKAEAVGARMRVGGLRIVDRAIRQLGRLRDARVIVVDDGTIALPRRLPANTERRPITGNVDAAVAALEAELGPETTTVAANFVWVQTSHPDRGMAVVDRASCRAANTLVFDDLGRGAIGIVDRLINRRISSRITRFVLGPLPISPSAITLLAGFVGLYGALMVATSAGPAAAAGYAVLAASVILDGCADELARLRLRQTALGAWLSTLVGDFVNVVMVLAMGLSLWRHGGTFLDMEIALAAAAMTLFYMAASYRELVRQGEADVMRLRWWFAYGQTLTGVTGAGSHSIKGVLLLGRRDVIILFAMVLAYFDLPVPALLYSLVVAIVRVVGALGQLITPGWRIRPPA
jgi:hypothetical protein